MNRIIMDKVRCMLSESGLPNKFWAEAASTACYLINRSPSSAIEFLVPELKWSTIKLYYAVFNENEFYKSNMSIPEVASSKQDEQDFQNQVNPQNLDENSQQKNAGNQNSGGGTHFQPENTYDICQNEAQADLHNNDEEIQGDEGPHTDNENSQQLDGYVLSRDRIRRQIRLAPRFANADFIAFALKVADLLELEEPSSYNEAKMTKDWPKWKKAMNEELDSLDRNHTWTLVNRPKGKRVIGYDMLIACKDLKEIQRLKDLLNSEFDMKDLGPAKRILGMDIIRNRPLRTLSLSQEGYISKLLEIFCMKDARSVNTPIGAHFKLKSIKEEATELEYAHMKSVP
ncbi:uncharacterized protein LOC142525037 [Primulina tabacum]|uniref:uncharacterized protein LOC142525037 n=1 Tax=Primulina tabacum TaxID=48773 RepID=UPI003F590B35